MDNGYSSSEIHLLYIFGIFTIVGIILSMIGDVAFGPGVAITGFASFLTILVKLINSKIMLKVTLTILSIILSMASPDIGKSQPAVSQQKNTTIKNETGKEKNQAGTTANYGKYEFTFKSLEGRTYQLKQFGGKVALVNIWAPWCEPCKKETDGLVRLYNSYHSKGFEIIGIAVQTTLHDVRKFVNYHNVRWPVGIEDDITKLYKSVGIPASYLFDTEGNLIKEFVGYCDEKVLKEVLDEIFKSPQPK